MKGFMRSRNPVARLVIAACVVGMVAVSGHSYAAVIWDWSFGGTEAGTFTTDGTLVDAGGAFNFAITNLTVTSSTVGSLVGQPYTESQPVQGFLWNGVSATQFYRSSGTYTNGSNFYVTDSGSNTYAIVFYADVNGSLGRLVDSNQTPVVSFSALTLTPSAVPEPAAYAMALAAAIFGTLTIRRRRV